MTFYAAGPPPALSRRPTKMKASERLQRPDKAYAYSSTTSPPKEHSSLPATGAPHRYDPAHRNTAGRSVSPHYKHDALPPLPEEATAAAANLDEVATTYFFVDHILPPLPAQPTGNGLLEIVQRSVDRCIARPWSKGR